MRRFERKKQISGSLSSFPRFQGCYEELIHCFHIDAFVGGEYLVSSIMEIEELMDELVSWQEVDWILQDAVSLDCEKEAFCDPWEALTSSGIGCLSPSSGAVYPDQVGVFETKEASETRPPSLGCENPEASVVLLGDGPSVDDGYLGVSSPGSCSGPEEGCKGGAISDFGTRSVCFDGSGASSYPELKQASFDRFVCPESELELKSPSPESGCNSSDELLQGGSCNQSSDLAAASGEDATITMDEETKKRIRLMRNRESATQSRLRKKSYIKELEMKCRMLESHCSVLQQTVAFASRENVLLRDELNKIKCENMNGSKSGVVEPAALPSDSLPSESPQRLTISGPFRLANWELLACLYHALLLILLETKVQGLARRGSRERRPWLGIRRCQVPWGSVLFTTLVSLGRLRWQMMSLRRRVLSCSSRAKKRNLLDITNGTSLLSSSVHQHQHSSKRRKHLRKCGRQRRRYEIHSRR